MTVSERCESCHGRPCVLLGVPDGPFVSGAHIQRPQASAPVWPPPWAATKPQDRPKADKDESKAARHAAWLAAGGKRKGA